MARLKYPKDWPPWLIQLKFQARQHNIWEYIDPTASAIAEDPIQWAPCVPKLEEIISERQNQLQEQYTRELQAARTEGEHGSPQQLQPPAPRVVTRDDVREEFATRLAAYDADVVENDEIRRGYRTVWNWVHATVDVGALSAAQATATVAGDCSLRGVVRALRGRFGPARDKKGSVVLPRLSSVRVLVRRASQRVQSLVKDSFHRMRPKPYTASSLLKLPNEMLFHIFGYLDLHDEFILRKTCRDMHSLLQKDWKYLFNRRTCIQRRDFLAGLGYTSPNHWVCGPCDKLHRIDTNDIPWHKPPINRCPRERPRACFLSRFEIRERHVQLGLKLTRFKTAADQKYLKKLMSPFTYEFDSYPGQRAESFHAAPKIIANRFILYIQRELIYETDLGYWQLNPERICQHIGGPESKALSPKELGNAVRLAVNQPKLEVTGHCLRCSIDYSVIVGPDPDKITIRAWYDLGSYNSPKDESWGVPDYGSGHIYDPGPIVYHDPGSIRRLYATGTTLDIVR
ncbi:hypothetical protein CFIO01_09911 [Colletotrichum fioriniae PJ7]|uniref:F-box domain-containing protein n=1 Tax=Colletotrichum fioriniae PJ7 TaxID=1445577 RepID=A0A010RUM7_9PEZI|nr:hypothetical protein CFIO01_09911 [Colletotrichum fioriniae PJ7]